VRRSRTRPLDPTTVAVDAMASYRLTRLLISDGIADRPRSALTGSLRGRGNRKLVELIECPWCTGFWVAVGVVAARRLVPAAWDPVARILAFSAAAGLVASRVRSLDDTHEVTTRLVEEDSGPSVDSTSNAMHSPAPLAH
jgi:hypothetical protein